MMGGVFYWVKYEDGIETLKDKGCRTDCKLVKLKLKTIMETVFTRILIKLNVKEFIIRLVEKSTNEHKKDI